MIMGQMAARYRAVSIAFAANFDERCVEIHIVSDKGETISVSCPANSIFTIQRHIEQLGHQCPEIAGWTHEQPADHTRY